MATPISFKVTTEVSGTLTILDDRYDIPCLIAGLGRVWTLDASGDVRNAAGEVIACIQGRAPTAAAASYSDFKQGWTP